MNKIKIILFGASDGIIQKTHAVIKHENCDIIALCDSDEHKQGIALDGLRVISIDQLTEMNFDFIIVGAWFSYHIIRKNLINAGIPDYKILPVLSIKNIMLLTAEIGTFPEEILEKIFNDDPKKLNAKILELNEVVKNYSEIQPFNKKDIDFVEYPLIAHAGGGLVNGKKIIYSNSIEAFNKSIKAGFKMFEFDTYGLLSNGDVIFGHDNERMDNLMFSEYTPLTFTKILSILVENPSLSIILDIRWNTYEDYEKTLTNLDTIISRDNEKWNIQIKQRIIMQAYDVVTIKCALKKGWKCLLTSYRNAEGSWLQKTAYLCCKFNLYGAVVSSNIIQKKSKYLKFLKEKKVPIIAFSVDSIDEYGKLRKLGIVSVMTNFLKP